MTQRITLVTTGGTIDKAYALGLNVRDLEVRGAAAFDVFKRMELVHAVTFNWTSTCAKDSMDITDDDRAKIVQTCVDADTVKILITHGTDTMIKTAEALSHSIQPDRTIVLTGAAIPACM